MEKENQPQSESEENSNIIKPQVEVESTEKQSNLSSPSDSAHVVVSPQQTATPTKHHFRPRLLPFDYKITIAIVFLFAIFMAGYQLAIYQTNRGFTGFPYFIFNTSDEASCSPCMGGVVENSTPPTPCAADDNSDVFCGAGKPVIYLYPTHDEQVNVKLSYAAGFSKTVPSYNSQTGWQVVARPNGILTNLANGKTYPYLYWEGKPAPFDFDMTEGFVVKGSQTDAFLQTQLSAMGLNQNETSAFIAYWLPKMNASPYNLIHFAGSDYTSYAKLTVSPKPDSLLRVFMAFEPLQVPVKVSPQSFPVFQRNGFTVVEWGGTQVAN